MEKNIDIHYKGFVRLDPWFRVAHLISFLDIYIGKGISAMKDVLQIDLLRVKG